MEDVVEFARLDDGSYECPSLALAGKTYRMFKSGEKWTVTLDDQKVTEGVTFKEAKAAIDAYEKANGAAQEEVAIEDGSEPQEKSPSENRSDDKAQWQANLSDGTAVLFKSRGEKQAKYRAYRIARAKSLKVESVAIATNATQD